MTAPGHRACVIQSTLARRHPLLDWLEGLEMSEYASEEIIVPTHVDWFQPLKDLVEKITAQDGEKIGYESLCNEQSKAIARLLALVESMDKRIEYCKENNIGWIESSVQMALFKSHKKASQDALDGLGMQLPLLHTDAIKVR